MFNKNLVEEKMIKKLLYFVFTFVFLFTLNLFAQEECEDETNTNIPALAEFHEIIYPIWHTAYPSKDVEALKSYVQEVNEKAERIYKVKLPGILREKEDKWVKGVEEFKNAVLLYNKAAESGSDQELLDAAELLHAKYEDLVRIIRPVVKELDEFHKVLYVIYHKYLPDKKWTEIRKECNELKEKAQKVLEAKLPKKLEAKKEEYQKLAADLQKAVNELCKAKDKEMEKAVENMHSKYEKLQELFE